MQVSFRECYKFAKDEKSQDDVVFAELMANGQRNLKVPVRGLLGPLLGPSPQHCCLHLTHLCCQTLVQTLP